MSNKIKGFVTLSARPFHKGHEALIDYAKHHCDELTILITTLPDEIIPYKYRLKWVLSTYLDDPKVTIIADTIEEPNLTGDNLSIWWGFYVKQKFGFFDRIFTSENYGDVFAETMGSEHWLFDKDRKIVPVSGTEIRERPMTNWDYLNNFAKDYFVKKIAIVGTESTGKTILTEQLANHFAKEYGEKNSYFVSEAGDDLVDNTYNVKRNQIQEIAKEHATRILRQTRKTNRVLFIDTDLNITKSYSRYFFKQVPKFEAWIEKANEMDLYIYLNRNAPYVQDGRRLSKHSRDELDLYHTHFFKDKRNCIEFDFEGDYNKRFSKIVIEIKKFLEDY